MFNNIRNLQISSIDENDNESEEQDASSTENGNVSTEAEETSSPLSSSERTNSPAADYTPTNTLCMRTMRTSLIVSLIISMLSTVTGSAARAGEYIFIKAMELYMRHSNMLCLLKGLLRLGEDDLISHGVNIRSEVEETGVSLDDIMLGNGDFGSISTIVHDEALYSANATNITEIEFRYSSVERIILNACERIKNITYFNEHSRNQLANTSELIRNSDTSYIGCPYTQFGSDVSISEHVNSTTTDRTVLRATVLIIVCTILSLIVMIIMRNPLQRRQRNHDGNRLGMIELKTYGLSTSRICLLEETDHEFDNDHDVRDNQSNVGHGCDNKGSLLLGNTLGSTNDKPLKKEKHRNNDVHLLMENNRSRPADNASHLSPDGDYPSTSQTSTLLGMVSSMPKNATNRRSKKIKPGSPDYYRSLDHVLTSSDSEIDSD